ncbi:hypothetical protein [Streptomyces sp. NPDC091212]|uniref:hypothetical protein n=1 Tax=Streptomyces sp. NPDC091212 TaxID=3155191 RepID=UPI003423D8E4
MTVIIFLTVGSFAAVLAVCAALGVGPALPGGHGTHRLALGVRQLRHDLADIRHELQGATEYIGRLEQDAVLLSRDLETARGTHDEDFARIAGLDKELAAAREENAVLAADLANARAVTPLRAVEFTAGTARARSEAPAAPTVADDDTAELHVPPDLLNITSAAWRSDATA